MAQVCWYFQIHQPWRLRPHSVFDVGRDGQPSSYFATSSDLDYDNGRVIQKVADKSYRPMLTLLVELLQRYPDFVCTFSISGVALEQLQEFAPDVVELLQAAVATGQVEILGETYYHSLAALYDPEEFAAQVELHSALMQATFGVTPRVFRNTELIYSNQIAQYVAEQGFDGMLAEGADHILHGRSPTRPYHAVGLPDFPVLLKHYRLSDDVAFRFSQRSWPSWPLRAETYVHWLSAPYAADDVIGLFMDFETFGEHQWADTGIFPFFERVIEELVASPHAELVTPSQVVDQRRVSGVTGEVFDAPDPVSWADVDRDITAWRGNPLQWDTLRLIYEMGALVHAVGETSLLADWRRLQTSDHFYYMCTKWAADGDVHAYFSPYRDPYQAYVNYSMVLADMRGRVS